MAEAVALAEDARGRSAPNPNVGCVIVSAGGKIVGKGATAAGGRPHAEAVALEQAGRERAVQRSMSLSSLAHTRVRADSPAPISWLKARAGASRGGAEGPRPADLGQGNSSACATGASTVKLGVGREAARRSLAGWLTRLEPRPPADHAQARAVDRRQDRAALRRIEMDHRRGRAPPCPPRACPLRHDPRRARHLSRRRAAARRSPSRPRGALAAARAADPRRGGRRLGNPSPNPTMCTDFMTSTTSSSKADRRPRPPFSPRTWSIES